MDNLKVIFFGTNEFSVEILKALNNCKDPNIEISCVCTKIAKPFGPKQILKNSEIFNWAIENKLHVETYKTLKKIEIQEELKSFKADIGIVASYGLILPQAVLDIFPLGCINVHASILPKYRGSAPIQRAIMKGEDKTGITIMKMDAGIDTGDILLQSEIEIKDKNCGDVFIDMAKLGGNLLIKYLKDYKNIIPQKQNNDNATYANKIENDDCLIDFHIQSAKQIYQKILALSPSPKAFFINNKNEKIFVIDSKIHNSDFDISAINPKKDIFIKCCDGNYIQLLTLQKEGRKILKSAEFLNGNKVNI